MNLPYIGLLSEYQKPPPDCRPEEYNAEDGILPPFQGESICKSDYVPQPHLTTSFNIDGFATSHVCHPTSRAPPISPSIFTRYESISKSDYVPQPLFIKCPTTKDESTLHGDSTSKSTQQVVRKNRSTTDGGSPTKPSISRPPMLLLPDNQPKVSESKASFQPFPLHLARATKPPWMQKQHKLKQHEARCDLTSSYQADYCGVMTKHRRICLDFPAGENRKAVTIPDVSHASPTKSSRQCLHSYESLHHHLHYYVNSLLFRTTTGAAYLPPSSFGGPPCHPPQMSYPEKNKSFQKCKIHFSQGPRRKTAT